MNRDQLGCIYYIWGDGCGTVLATPCLHGLQLRKPYMRRAILRHFLPELNITS